MKFENKHLVPTALSFPIKNVLRYSQAYITQTEYIVMMTNVGSTKIVNIMTTETGVLELGCGHIGYIGDILKMVNFIKP